jgi:glutathione-regulated potassium-efflux system ancillary protein KefF
VLDRIRSWPDWPEMQDLPACLPCDTPATERPIAAP